MRVKLFLQIVEDHSKKGKTYAIKAVYDITKCSLYKAKECVCLSIKDKVLDKDLLLHMLKDTKFNHITHLDNWDVMYPRIVRAKASVHAISVI